jgi:UDP-4-amino-4,6-dideoxy-N-acetyl-beta-L-altrosamine transaminase
MIPYGRQSISAEDIQAVVDTLQSDFLTQGPAVPAFEQALAGYCQVPYAVAINSATSALHLACLALDVLQGDIVWTSPISFVASANCALYCGADIDFVDVDATTGLMSVQALATKLQQAAAENRLPKVLIPVHLAGHSCAMQEIAELCKPYNIRIIEDASHAIGGQYQQQKVGSCQYSDLTIFSFHPVKIITSAEGGMAMTKDASIAGKLRLLRSHGITRDPQEMTEASHGPWYYQQIALGLNYRMTDLQAALGLSQSKRLDHFVNRRQEIAGYYHQALANLPISLPAQPDAVFSAYHLFIIRLSDQHNRQQIFSYLRAHGIGVNVHYIPIHLQPYYQQLGFKSGDFPAAEIFYQSIISIPMYPDLTQAQLDFISSTIRNSLSINFDNSALIT